MTDVTKDFAPVAGKDASPSPIRKGLGTLYEISYLDNNYKEHQILSSIDISNPDHVRNLSDLVDQVAKKFGGATLTLKPDTGNDRIDNFRKIQTVAATDPDIDKTVGGIIDRYQSGVNNLSYKVLGHDVLPDITSTLDR